MQLATPFILMQALRMFGGIFELNVLYGNIYPEI